jgi:hypothetical protein
MRTRLLAASLLTLVTSGCITSTVGSRTVAPAQFQYNQALARSWDEQLLLNLVRLRYRDTPVFLSVSSVTTQYSWTAGANAGTSFSGSRHDSTALGIGGEYAERPTISYDPLRGKDFVTQLLTPIPPISLALLSRSGWSIERLMRCCVHSIGEVYNAPSAAGPTPALAPDVRSFRHLSSTLRRLQMAGALEARSTVDKKVVVWLGVVDDPDLRRARAALLRSIGHPAGPDDVVELPIAEYGEPGSLVVTGRSLLAALYYLSQAVEPPSEHSAAGLVTATRRADGTPFDWSEVTGGLFRIRSSRDRPANVFVAVEHRGTWFFIADDDLDSKTTFGLLTFLFSLQATGEGSSPLLTLSAGG